MRRRRFVEFALVASLMFGAGTPLHAQAGSEGTIEGSVVDPSGAVIAGVRLSASNSATGAASSTTTDEHGLFRFLAVAPGRYEISATHPGFATLIEKNIVVTVGAQVDLELVLRVASSSDSLVVTGESPILETTRSAYSSTLDQRMISSLPVNGRNFTDFIVLTPGVVVDPLGGGPSFGGQRSLNLMLADGASDSNPFGGGPFGNLPYQFSLETVQEFQVNTNGYSAELGRAANGIISTITKTGTNDYHGTMFWFYRDKALNATDVIRKLNGQPKEPLHVNQFGAAGGGPILKNKLFFFAGYDGQRRQLQNLVFLNLPAGFKLSPLPSIAAYQQRALDYLTPRAESYVQTFNEDPFLARIDWQFTAREQLSARWNGVWYHSANSRNSGLQNSLEHTGDAPATNVALAVALTSEIGSGTSNQVRFNYLYNKAGGDSNTANPQANVFEQGQRVLLFGRAVSDPTRNFVHQYEVADTLRFTRGRHSLGLGADIIASRVSLSGAPSFSGNYRFNSLESFGRSLAGTPIPQPGETYIQAFSGLGLPGYRVFPNSTELAGFIQDEWRVLPSFTVNFGVRYDIELMASPKVQNPTLLAAGLDTTFVPTDGNNFAPRLGFAWSPLRNQTLVIRGAYGFYYGWLRDAMAARAHYQNGISVQTRTITGAAIPAYPNTLCGPPDPTGVPPSCPAPTAGIDAVMLVSPGYVQPYDQHAILGVEYQLQKNLAVSVSYLRVKGSHLQRWRDINLAAPTQNEIGVAGTSSVLAYDLFPSKRPIDGVGRVLSLESAGSSVYDALAMQVDRRFAQNFQLLAAFTLSRTNDDRPEPLIFDPGSGLESALLSNPNRPQTDRGPGVLDTPQRFVVSGIWQLDYGRTLRGVAKALLRGWEVSGILAYQAGQPYSGIVNFDLNNDGNPFSDRTPGQARNVFRYPATVSLDPRVTRNVAFNGRVRLQLIWEAFNVLNRANIINVRTTQYSRSTSVQSCAQAGVPCLVPQTSGASAFGVPTDTSGPRIMQLGAKLIF